MKKIAQIALLAILFSSCSAMPVVPSATPPAYTDTSAIATILPTATKPIINTPVVTSTPTLQPISAPTAINDGIVGVKSKCVEVGRGVQSKNLGSGVTVLESRSIGPDGRIEPGFYFMNMNTGLLTNLNEQNEMLKGGSVSPDRTLLSVERALSELLIMSANGKINKEIPLEKGWGFYPAWIDNQNLIVNIAGMDPDESKVLKPGKMLWFNPFTGEKRILAPDFPNIYAGYPLPNWDEPWSTSLVIYNPSLTRAIYLAEPGVNYVLWDMQKKKALIDWTTRDKQHHPRWSPDGSRFLMNVVNVSSISEKFPDGLYLVDENGNVLLPAILNTSVETHISLTDYFWSPSGRYVVLLPSDNANIGGESKNRLLVLDIQTKQITDYCVEFNLFDPTEPSLIWSPDETQILLNDKYSEAPRRRRVILVDLAKGTAFPIAEDVIATGWMKAP